MARLTRSIYLAVVANRHSLGAGLLAVLGGLGRSDGLTFGAELNPGLDGLLSLSGNGGIHFLIPWIGGLQTSYAMSTLNNASESINISSKFRDYNRLPSLIWRILLTPRDSRDSVTRNRQRSGESSRTACVLAVDQDLDQPLRLGQVLDLVLGPAVAHSPAVPYRHGEESSRSSANLSKTFYIFELH